jgi:hypothetical protein
MKRTLCEFLLHERCRFFDKNDINLDNNNTKDFH